MFDLEAREQGHVVVITLHTIDVARHDLAHECLSLLKNIIGIDENFADVGLEVVADCTNHQAAFLENQQGCVVVFGDRINGRPKLHQVV